MRSDVFFTLLCLFPTLIYGLPAWVRRDGNDTSSSNSTESPATPPVDNGSSTSTNSTSSTATPPSDSNSSSIATGSDLANQLMTLNLLTLQAFYEQASVISQGHVDNNASALLGAGTLINNGRLTLLNNTAGNVNCSFDFHTVLVSDALVASMAYLESITLMGAASLTNNGSLQLSQAQQDVFASISEDASLISASVGPILLQNVPLNIYPNLTVEDYTSLLFKFKPSCLADLGLQNTPSVVELGFTSPFRLPEQFRLEAISEGCSNTVVNDRLPLYKSAPIFCHLITPNITQQVAIVTPATSAGNCELSGVPGPNLYYIAQSDIPLPVDLTQRQVEEQGGSICSGPELLFLQSS